MNAHKTGPARRCRGFNTSSAVSAPRNIDNLAHRQARVWCPTGSNAGACLLWSLLARHARKCHAGLPVVWIHVLWDRKTAAIGERPA